MISISPTLLATAKMAGRFISIAICLALWIWKSAKVRLAPFLLTHEIVEKALLDELGLHYLHAHQIALRAERDAVKAAGVGWSAYQAVNKKNEKPISEEKLKKIPKDLDLTP
ncbi:hypothetical protein [Mesorhizobium sp. M0244]|uniref:hypothetical protein n=1 Tax=Mesorhizobium sp. M0244 TaxID=2956926 RepID=UPI00333A2C36